MNSNMLFEENSEDLEKHFSQILVCNADSLFDVREREREKEVVSCGRYPAL